MTRAPGTAWQRPPVVRASQALDTISFAGRIVDLPERQRDWFVPVYDRVLRP